MANLSFGISNSTDFYHKLIGDYSDYLTDLTSPRLAINCAMTAWHLGEWLYEEFKVSLRGSFGDKPAFLNHLETTECVALEIMHRITNGSKHCSLPGQSHSVQDTSVHIGTHSEEFASEFDQTGLIVTLDDGSEVWFDEQLKTVIEFWQEYIPRQFGLTL